MYGEPKDSDVTKLLICIPLGKKKTLRSHLVVLIGIHKSVAELDMCGLRVLKGAQVLISAGSMEETRAFGLTLTFSVRKVFRE